MCATSYNDQVPVWARKTAWFVATLFASPLVPAALACWAYRERRHHRPVLAGFPDFVVSLTKPSRIAFFTVAFIGGELVAIDWSALTYFNAVDEHVPSVIGLFVVMVLGAVVIFDLVIRNSVAGLRHIAERRRDQHS